MRALVLVLLTLVAAGCVTDAADLPALPGSPLFLDFGEHEFDEPGAWGLYTSPVCFTVGYPDGEQQSRRVACR